MMNTGYIEKSGEEYFLTSRGKEYANRMDTDQTSILKQAKVGVLIACTRRKRNMRQYLLYTRLKQPFYGCQGFMTGKVRYGEKVTVAAGRELKEETGLLGKPEIVTIKHYLVFDKNAKDLLEDKFMYFCLVKDPKGTLRSNREGKFEWVDEKDLRRYVTNHFESFSAFQEQIRQIKNFKGQITLQEIVHESVKF